MDETYEPEVKAFIYGITLAIPFIVILEYLGQLLAKILPDNILGLILYFIIGFSFLFGYLVLAFLIIDYIEIGRHIRKNKS